MPRLETLFLTGSRVTSSGLRWLAKMPSLENLSVGSDAIDATGLEHLHHLTQLQTLWLDIPQNDETDDALTRLREALPKCSVRLMPSK